MPTVTIELSDLEYSLLIAQSQATMKTPEEVLRSKLTDVSSEEETDPLLRLAGVLESEIPDISSRHDEYLGHSQWRDLRDSHG